MGRKDHTSSCLRPRFPQNSETRCRMGASSWHYFTPYDPDPEVALQRLRQLIFESGQYGDPMFGGGGGGGFGETARQAAMGFLNYLTGSMENLSPAEQQMARQLQASLELLQPELREQLMQTIHDQGEQFRRPPGSRPASIEDALEEAAEEGTHSILDIEH